MVQIVHKQITLLAEPLYPRGVCRRQFLTVVGALLGITAWTDRSSDARDGSSADVARAAQPSLGGHRHTTMTDPLEGPLAPVKNLSLSIAVQSLEETASWYEEQLGFEIVQRRDFPEYGTRIAFLETNGIRIELIEDQHWSPLLRPDPPQHTTIQGVSQITFEVDDIEEAIRRVKSRPITIAWDLTVVEDLRLKEFFIRDNEGNIVQFIEYF